MKDRKVVDLKKLAEDEVGIDELTSDLEKPAGEKSKLWSDEFSASGEKVP